MGVRQPRRRRLTIGSLLLLVALAAIGLSTHRRLSEWWRLRVAHPSLATFGALVMGPSLDCAGCHSPPSVSDPFAWRAKSVLGPIAKRGPTPPANHPSAPAGGDCRSCHRP